MEIRYADQRIFVLSETLLAEHIRQRAMDKRSGAVAGGLGGLIQRPKTEEVELADSQKRFEPFWHVVASARYVYDRSRKYSVPASGPEVAQVSLTGQTYPVADMGKAGRAFSIDVTEHCREEVRREAFVDGLAGGALADGPGLANSPKVEITDPASLSAEGAIVVPPETRASFVVRQVLGQVMKPIQADVLHEEIISLEVTDLYYRPIWAFEFVWKSKDKRGVIEFDGVTGQTRTGQSLMPKLTKAVTRDALFDIGADTVGMLVPGGSIAVRVVKIALDAKK